MNIIFGSSGHAKEIEYILRSHNSSSRIKIDYFISKDLSGNFKDIMEITEDTWTKKILNANDQISAFIAIGDGNIRRDIVIKYNSYKNILFPNLIAKSVTGDFKNILLETGNIFYPTTILTTDIIIGNHNHFNLNTSISHDCVIGNFNSFSPGAILSGNVTVGNNNFFGVGSKVIPKVKIADNVIIGAGAVVINDIPEPGTYLGVPAKKIK